MTSSPQPSQSVAPTTTSPSLAKLAREKSFLIPPHIELAANAERHYSIIEKSLAEAGNLKKSIKEDIDKSAYELWDMVETYNCDMTSHCREIVSIILNKIAEQDEIKHNQSQDIKQLNNKIDKLIEQVAKQQQKISELSEEIIANKINNEQKQLEEQILKQNLHLKQEILELKKEVKTIKDTERKSGLELLEAIKNQNNLSEKTKQDLVDLKNEIKTKVENEAGLLEELKKQSATCEKTQQYLQDLKENIKEIPSAQQIPTIIQAPKTYAQTLKEVTPKPTHCLLVGTDDTIDTSEEVLTKIKTALNAKNKGLQISKLRKVKDQRVLIGSDRKGDIEYIRKTLENKKFKVETKRNKDPLIIMRNLLKSNTDEDILQALKKQNSDILDHIAEEDYRISIRHRRRARNPLETHVVLEVSPQVWQALTTAGKAYVDLQRVPVFDLSPLVQCSRCLAFGHGKKWCTETVDLCSHCTGSHMRTECPSLLAGEEPTCKNCQQAKCTKTNHNSFDLHCPVRGKWDTLARSSIVYS